MRATMINHRGNMIIDKILVLFMSDYRTVSL